MAYKMHRYWTLANTFRKLNEIPETRTKINYFYWLLSVTRDTYVSSAAQNLWDMELDIHVRNRYHRRRHFACGTLPKTFQPRRTNMQRVVWPEMALPRRVIGHDDYAKNFANLWCTLLYHSGATGTQVWWYPV